MPQQPQDNDAVEIHVIFRGHVQGVGFRATARHYAKQLNLKGTVRNSPDGSVEAYIQGPRQNIRQLFSLIQQKIGLGRIAEISEKKIFPLHTYIDFEILR